MASNYMTIGDVMNVMYRGMKFDIPLTVAQAAVVTGKSRNTITRWTNEGRIHKITRYGLVGYDREELILYHYDKRKIRAD